MTATKKIQAAAPAKVTICEVDPCRIKIGAGAVEATIRGENFTPDMEAAVCTASGAKSPGDKAILVEQPLPGDVTPDRFPITITVPNGTLPSIRAVILLQGSTEVSRHDTGIELV